MAVGGVFFLTCLAYPLQARLGPGGERIAAACARLAGWSALSLVLTEGVSVALQTAVLTDTVGITAGEVLTAHFAVAGLIKMAAAAAMGVLLFTAGSRAR